MTDAQSEVSQEVARPIGLGLRGRIISLTRWQAVFKLLENAFVCENVTELMPIILNNASREITSSLERGHFDAYYRALKDFVLGVHSNPMILSKENKYEVFNSASEAAWVLSGPDAHSWMDHYNLKGVYALFAEARKNTIREIVSRVWKKLRCFGRCFGVFVLTYAEISLRPGNTAFLESMRRFDECAKRQRVV